MSNTQPIDNSNHLMCVCRRPSLKRILQSHPKFSSDDVRANAIIQMISLVYTQFTSCKIIFDIYTKTSLHCDLLMMKSGVPSRNPELYMERVNYT